MSERVVVVAGAAGPIGRATVARFAAAGATVIGTDAQPAPDLIRLDPADPALAPDPAPAPDAHAEAQQWESRIAGAIAEVEDGTANAAANMQQLHERAERTRGTASDLASLADDVASSVEALRGQVNKLIEDVRAAFLELMRSKGESTPDEEVLGDAVAFSGVSKYPARVKCALLPWMALADAEAKAGIGPAQVDIAEEGGA